MGTQDQPRTTISYGQAWDKCKACVKCMMFEFNTPMLLEACASVAIEHELNTRQMFISFMYNYHKNGHKVA